MWDGGSAYRRTVRTYILYARRYRKSCTGNRAKGRGELNRTMVIVRSVISVKSITDGTINDIASCTRSERFGQKVTKLDTVTWMGSVKISLRNREDTPEGERVELVKVEWQIGTSEARWRSEVDGSG